MLNVTFGEKERGPRMILNAYAVLDAFISLLRLALGLLVLWLSVSAWRSWFRNTPGPEERKALEDRYYLLFLLAGLLLALNILSWPIFYLLLQSYVPEWQPAVMCIYGVTQIGLGTLGPSRFLPRLVTGLQTTKPLLVFLSGAWFVLYLVNRRTRTAPLTGRVLLLLLAAGLLAIADAAAEVPAAGPGGGERREVAVCGVLWNPRRHGAGPRRLRPAVPAAPAGGMAGPALAGRDPLRGGQRSISD